MTPPTGAAAAQRIEGVVEHGDERGRLLGFPTANLGVHGQDLRDGVWAGLVEVDPGTGRATTHVAAVSVGHRPTYYDRTGERLLEANLLDFSGDLYGRRVIVHLITRLRPQRRSTGSEELVTQLRADVAAVREWAAGAGHSGS
ncbi:riboflavin kinase [Kineococcus rhizosphaerae]|uniref:riboflavin kinase n=1 Tax=Kineococcus rhizosphaerae TaxID=559628 RepID=A0A2T0R6E7_9ACTN|nr:riboflavin kinase [Kineococcus rhizosphaerae]PRY16745.1 riboflavin kinase/FMN adenylyltransferase [Kineococcus rhizosphaerae]